MEDFEVEKRSTIGCGLSLFLAAAMVVGLIAEGIVIMTLWEWFIVPSFGLPAISITTALGISLILGLTTSNAASSISGVYRQSQSANVNVGAVVKFGVCLTVVPLLFLLFGFFVRLFA